MPPGGVLEDLAADIVDDRLRLVCRLLLLILGFALVDAQHLLVMNQNLRRQPLDNPIVHESLEWRYSLLWVPLEALLDEVLESFALAHQDLVQGLGGRHPQVLLRVFREVGLVRALVEEDVLPPRLRQDLLVREPDHLHDEGQLLLLRFSGKERHSGEQLREYAAEAPHVDCGRVRDPKDDLRGPVEPGLNVGVYPLVCEAAGAKVDDLDARLVGALQKNILRLEVTMNEGLFPQVLESLKYLDGKPANQRERHSFEVVVLDELVEVDGEQLEGNDEMLPEHAVVFDSDDVVRVIRVILFQVEQDLQLDPGLVLEFLLVPDDFDGHDLAGLVVDALQGLSEGALPEELNNFKSVGNVVLEHHVVVSSLIVEAVIVLLLPRAFYLFRAQAQVVAHFVVQDLAFLVLCEARPPQVVLQDFGSGEREAELQGRALGGRMRRLLLIFDDADLGVHEQVVAAGGGLVG